MRRYWGYLVKSAVSPFVVRFVTARLSSCLGLVLAKLFDRSRASFSPPSPFPAVVKLPSSPSPLSSLSGRVRMDRSGEIRTRGLKQGNDVVPCRCPKAGSRFERRSLTFFRSPGWWLPRDPVPYVPNDPEEILPRIPFPFFLSAVTAFHLRSNYSLRKSLVRATNRTRRWSLWADGELVSASSRAPVSCYNKLLASTATSTWFLRERHHAVCLSRHILEQSLRVEFNEFN